MEGMSELEIMIVRTGLLIMVRATAREESRKNSEKALSMMIEENKRELWALLAIKMKPRGTVY